MCVASCIARHTSHVTRHTSHVTHHTSHITHLAENGAKCADASGVSQAARALVPWSSSSNNGANLALNFFNLVVGDGCGVGEIKAELCGVDLAALLVAVGPYVGAKGEVEYLGGSERRRRRRRQQQQQQQPSHASSCD